MSGHSVVFNMRIQLPGTEPGAGQVSYEQMMATFDRTREAGVKEGWQRAIRELRKATEGRSDASEAAQVLDELIAEAAKFSPFRGEASGV